MKRNEKGTKNRVIGLLVIVIILQTLIFIKAGIDKSYMFMDEVWSFALTQYDKYGIYDNEDFYDTWHTKEYYEDYISLRDDQIFDFKPVWENQKNDVHPPLYYLILRLFMMFSLNHFSKWPSLILNIIIYSFITVFVYLILNKLLYNKPNHEVKSIILAFLSSITLISLSNVTFIRMYTLSTLNILMTTYLHMKLYKDFNRKNLVLIGISVIIGYLTHYHYIFYMGILYLITVIGFLINKERNKFKKYTLTLITAGIIALGIWPFSIKHLLFTDRGVETITNLGNFKDYMDRVIYFVSLLGMYNFNIIMGLFMAIIIVAIVLKIMKNSTNEVEISEYFKIVWIPTLVYFLLVATSVHFMALRYLYPIAALSYISIVYITNQLLETFTSKKTTLRIMSTLLILTMVATFVSKIEPQYMYRDKKQFMLRVEKEFADIPAIYWTGNLHGYMFLANILPFITINESYITKDSIYNNDKINDILKDKDISNGVLLFVKYGSNLENIKKAITNTTKLKSITCIEKLWCCDVYYIH